MKIAILGWGSLIWDPRELHYRGRWYRNGPTLPIEFSRISSDGRLTLVIDEKNGAQVVTRYSFSSLPDLKQAISDLNAREGRPGSERIGFIELKTNTSNPDAKAAHPIAFERIRAWGIEKKLDAVIWTALGPNFDDRRKKPFSPQEAVKYLGEMKAALEYVRRAPKEVVTSVRVLWNGGK